jgi:hypothetical protein
VKQIKIDAGSSNIIRFRENLTDDFREAVLYPMVPAPTRKRNSKTFVFTEDFDPAYSGPLSISAKKYADLQNLCQAGIIPAVHHNYYLGLNPTDEDSDRELDEIDEFFI